MPCLCVHAARLERMDFHARTDEWTARPKTMKMPFSPFLFLLFLVYWLTDQLLTLCLGGYTCETGSVKFYLVSLQCSFKFQIYARNRRQYCICLEGIKRTSHLRQDFVHRTRITHPFLPRNKVGCSWSGATQLWEKAASKGPQLQNYVSFFKRIAVSLTMM